MWGRDTLQAVLPWLLYGAACALSYVKSDLTENDFERFADLRLTVAFFAILLALCAHYLDRVARPGAVARALLWGGWAAFLLPLLAMFPVGSKDVFAYSFHARMWGAHGMNPYLEPSTALAGDDWLRFLKVWWASYPAPYGPLALEQGRAVHALAGASLPAMVLAFKLYNVVLLVLSAWLLADLAERAKGEARAAAARSRAILLWLWCPLVLFEVVGNAHNDATMTVLLLAAVALHLRERWLLSLALLLLAFWYKWYSIVLLPVWLARQWRAHQRLPAPRQMALAAALGGVVSGLVLVPFWGSWTAMSERVLLHENVFRIFPNELPPPLWLLFHAGEWSGLRAAEYGGALFNAARFSLLAASLAWIVWRRRGQVYGARAYGEDCFLSLFAFFSLGVTILWPWHLLGAVAFALATGERRCEWAAALLTTVGLLSYFLTFAIASLLCAAVTAALWLLRRGGGAAAAAPVPR